MKSSSYIIRPARPGDLGTLQAIELRAAKLFLETPHAWLAEADGMGLSSLEKFLRDGWIWVAAVDADEPVGFAAARTLDGTMYLHEIDVDPVHGRRGVGARLVRHAVERAREFGFHAVTLTTFVDVPWNAPFYAKLGFRVVPVDELGPQLLRDLRNEEKVGFDLATRVVMIRDIGSPTERCSDAGSGA